MFSETVRFFAKWEGPVIAVASWRLRPEESNGALSPFKAATIVSGLDRPFSDSLRTVAALYEAATGIEFHPLRSAPAATMFAAVGAAARDGRLLLFAGWRLDDIESAAEVPHPSDGTPQDELVRDVMRDRAQLDFEGRRYRFVPALRWSEVARKGSYGIVPLAEARGVVARMVQRMAPNPHDREPWDRVAELLADIPAAAAVFLLRDRPSGGVIPKSSSATIPAITPSKAVPVAEKTWVEIHVNYDDGTPFDGNCCVELPDGRKTEGTPDEHGIVRLEGLEPGSCTVSFPDLDASGWKPS